MTGHRHRRGSVQIQALPRQRANRGHLSKQDARTRDRRGDQLRAGGQRLLSGQRPHPLQRLKTDRPHHNQLAGHRLQKQRRLTNDLTELGFNTRRTDQLLQILQPRATLAAERNRIRLPGVQPIDKGVSTVRRLGGNVGGFTVAPCREPFEFVDRHALNLLFFRVAAASNLVCARRH